MKIKILAIAILGLVFQTSWAQQSSYDFTGGGTKEKAGLFCSLGVVAGGDFSFMKSSDAAVAPSKGIQPGFNVGAAFNMRFLKRNARSTAETGLLAIQPEVRYATAGCKVESSALSLSYVMIPIMFQIYPTKHLFIELGPEAAINVGHSPENLACGTSQLVLSNLKANDVMLGTGLGIRLNCGLTVSARYNIGFSDAASNLPWRNNIIQVNLGWLFRLSKSNTGSSTIVIED